MSDPDPGGEPVPTIAKPDALLALHGVTAEMFATLRGWFDVPAAVTLDLAEVDSAVTELGDPQLVAAMAMRKLQALHLLATPGVRTTTDVVVTIVNDLDRALIQAPSMHLSRRAESTDWDAALVDLGTVTTSDADDERAVDHDAEVDHFRHLHTRLHDAVRAVIEASDGEIRYLM